MSNITESGQNVVIDTGDKLALPLLRVAGLRAKATIMADFIKQPREAMDLLDTIAGPSDPNSYFLIHYTSGCIAHVNGFDDKALLHLESALQKHGNGFSSYRIDAKYRLSVIYSKLRRLQDAKHLLSKLLSLATKQRGFTHYDRAEMLGELAWIHWANGDRTKACGALYACVQQLLAGWDIQNPRFREAANKTDHALGWYVAIALSGQQPTSTMEGETYAPIEPGFFYLRRERLGTYTPPQGFSKGLLSVFTAILGSSSGLYRLAWMIYNSNKVSHDEPGRWMANITEIAHLESIFSPPAQAFDTAVHVVHTLTALGAMKQSVSTIAEQSDFIEQTWEQVPLPKRHEEEKHVLLYHVLAPSLLRIVTSSHSAEQATKQWHEWESVLAPNRATLTEPGFWSSTLSIFYKLLSGWYGEVLRVEELELPTNEPLLYVLWYLIGATQDHIKLVDKATMHVFAVDFLISANSGGKHVLYEAAKFLHRFWADLIRERSFAFNNPQLYLQQLENIKRKDAGITAIDVVLIAAKAIGIRFPKSTLTNFQQYRTQEQTNPFHSSGEK